MEPTCRESDARVHHVHNFQKFEQFLVLHLVDILDIACADALPRLRICSFMCLSPLLPPFVTKSYKDQEYFNKEISGFNQWLNHMLAHHNIKQHLLTIKLQNEEKRVEQTEAGNVAELSPVEGLVICRCLHGAHRPVDLLTN